MHSPAAAPLEVSTSSRSRCRPPVDGRSQPDIRFWHRAHAHFAGLGITRKRTRPYRPQTNGEVERFRRTLADEWA
ncbi:hypothetical protein GCM10018965_005500 [Nonomuraea roseola]